MEINTTDLWLVRQIGGCIAQRSHTCTSSSSPGFKSHNFGIFLRGKIINIAEVYKHRWLEESGPWLENVDQTHLVLTSGKPEPQKKKTERNDLAYSCCQIEPMCLVRSGRKSKQPISFFSERIKYLTTLASLEPHQAWKSSQDIFLKTSLLLTSAR